MFKDDYKIIRIACERLGYLRRSIKPLNNAKAINGLLSRVIYRIEEILADAEFSVRPIHKLYLKEEFDYICNWLDYLKNASLAETEYTEYLEQARIELRNMLNNLGVN